MQHGDLSVEHILMTPGGVRLIDGEYVGIGCWGRDEAFLIAQCRDTSLSSQDWLKGALNILCENELEKKLVAIWCLIEATYQIARTYSLNLGDVKKEELEWFHEIKNTITII